MAKSIIFDVDGTLRDSVYLHALAWQDAFHDLGHDIELKAVRDQIGKGGDQLLPVFLSAAEIEETGEALEKHRGNIMHERYMDRIVAFPEVRKLFQHLLGKGKQIALASPARQAELGHYKKLAHIVDLLDDETSSHDAEKSKPHPDIFQAALAKLGDVRPEDAIVVGDTPYDAQAASKAGIGTVGLLCGGWSETDLRAAGCVSVYRTLRICSHATTRRRYSEQSATFHHRSSS